MSRHGETAARLYISVVLAAALDPPRGALADRVGVQHSSPAHARPTPRVAPMDAYNGPRWNAPAASRTDHAMRSSPHPLNHAGQTRIVRQPLSNAIANEAAAPSSFEARERID